MSKPSVLTVYNAYLNRGGEDEVFEAEAELLESRGHRVERFRLEPDAVKDGSLRGRLDLAVNTVWSRRYRRRFAELTRSLQPDVVHFHNTFPSLSPSVYGACRANGAAVVQTLHNYRLICPATVLYRDGSVCTDCVGATVAWPAVRHACFHGSRAQTAVIATMLGVHRARGTWHKDVDRFVAPTEFARQQFVAGGLPPDRIVVKPNFVDVPAPGQRHRDGFLFVGRLVEHKGVATLLDAWRRLPDGVPLTIAGDGPMASEVAAFAAARPNVTYLGRQPNGRVLEAMRRTRALIFASTWYETFGLTLVEAFGCGLPVIAADLGAAGSELVQHDVTGRLFRPGDASDLAAQVTWMQTNAAAAARIGAAARREYEHKYTPEANYRQLLSIYEDVAGLRSAEAVPRRSLTAPSI